MSTNFCFCCSIEVETQVMDEYICPPIIFAIYIDDQAFQRDQIDFCSKSMGFLVIVF
jgi:hypothetical protein